MSLFSLDELRAAHAVVGEVVPETPAYRWPLLAQRLQADVVVKHENHTPIGAFKVRGGVTYIDRLRRSQPNVRGIISATRGNHGQSLALAAGRAGLPVAIVVPKGNSTEKNAAMRAFGADLLEHGDDFQQAAEHARKLSAERSLHMVPSFHADLVVGVATYALELLSRQPDMERLYVSIGQGSGICGCIMARDLLGLKTEIVGVQAEGAPSYVLSFKAGDVVTTEGVDTFADGMATRVPDQAALDVILKGAAEVVTVRDDEIADAMRIYWTDTHNLAEGAGAAPLAAAIRDRAKIRGRRIGLILSGGNIDLDLFQRVIGQAAGRAAD